MPILIRIIVQRLLFFIYSFLAFLGIAPETKVLSYEEAKIATEERRESIGEIIQDQEVRETIKEILDGAQKIKENIDKITITPSPINLPRVEKTEQTENQIQKVIEQITKSDDLEQSSSIDIDQNKIKEVLVQIVCSERKGNTIGVSTGSGVIVDPKGIILTNAHVGQFVLLEDNADKKTLNKCAVYKENIPTFGYLVDVLYISPQWIEENYKLINSQNPMGTGEFDYALLYIRENTNSGVSRPSRFSYVNLNFDEKIYEEGKTVVVAGYPGSPQNIMDIVKAGILKQDLVSIKDVFTFKRYTPDIITTTKTTVGAKGTSGGGVFDKQNNLIAIISTTSGEINNAEINAITTTYINSSIRENYGRTMLSLFSKPEEQVSLFAQIYGKNLADLLMTELNN